MISEDERVSVVVPAYNAEATLDETLRSVRAQTHRNLEIAVVDDGSRDGTAAVAERHARVDPRVRVLRQANAGVAAARNLGVAETRGRLVAPVDADDLWAPRKIERQLEAMRRGGGRVGLVYTWYAIIDENSRVVLLDTRSEAEGDVREALCFRNIVGNGSSPLMLREAVEAAGGYDPGLRARKAQGSEDWKLYFGVAERCAFALVREPLMGYRESAANMSSDFEQMLRSRDICAAEIAARYPEYHKLLDRGRTRLMRFMLSRAVRTGRREEALAMAKAMFAHDPPGAAANVAELAVKAVSGRLRRAAGRSSPPEERPMFPVGVPVAV